MKAALSIIKSEKLVLPIIWVAVLLTVLISGHRVEINDATAKATSIAPVHDFAYNYSGSSTTTAINDDLVVNNLDEFRKINNTPATVFKVKNHRDTTVTGKKGVKVFIPENSFDVDDPNAEVKIELKEYTSKNDFILSGLTTSSNGRLLESGGTVYINATCNGKKVDLKAGKDITLGFPNAKPKPDMQSFYGEKQTDGTVNWQPDTRDVDVNKKRYKMKQFISYETKPKSVAWVTGNFYVRSIGSHKDATKYTDTTEYKNVIDFLEHNFKVSNTEYDLLKGTYFLLKFSADKQGNVKKAYVAHEMHKRNNYSNAWNRLQAVDRIRYRLRSLLTSMPCVERTPFNKSEYVVVYIDKFEKFTDKSEVFNIEPKGKGKEVIVNKWVTDSTATTDVSSDYNLISSAKLGYINCDRFYPSANNANVYVKFNQPKTGDRCVHMVFVDQMSVVRGVETTTDDWIFMNTPQGEDVNYLVFEYRKDAVYYCIQSESTSNTEVNCKAKFKPLVIEHLINDLNNLKS